MSQTNLPLLLKQIGDTFHLILHCNSYINIFILVVICSLIYYTLFTPINTIRALEDVGYHHLDTSKYKNRKTKAELVNEVLRRKEVGDQPPVYPNGWYALIESPDIKCGQVKHVQALGENFAVMGTTTGQIHVLDAYCPHLGANMAVGGVVRGDCLECSFHGWRFCGEDGTCSHIPYSDKVPKSAHVKTWTSSEVNRLIFVWYHAEGEPPSWQIERIPEVENGWSAVSLEYTISCHIQDYVENVADMQHFPALHYDGVQAGGESWRNSGWLRRAIMQHTVSNAQWRGNLGSGQEHKSYTHFEINTTLFERFKVSKKIATNITQVGPAFSYAEFYPKILDVMTATPIEPLLLRVRIKSYCPQLVFFPLNKLFNTIFLPLALERDILMWSHKKCLSKPLLCQEDECLARFRRWFKQFYSPNSPRYPLQQSALEW